MNEKENFPLLVNCQGKSNKIGFFLADPSVVKVKENRKSTF